MQQQDARGAGADALQRGDEQCIAQPLRLGMDDAGEVGPVGERQRQHRAFDRRAQQLRQGEREDQLRQCEEDVGHPHDRFRHQAAAIAGDEAERHADGHGEADDHQCHLQRAAGTEDDAGEDVPAQIVGAEGEGGAGRLQSAQQMRRAGVFRVGRDPGAEDRQDDDPDDQQRPDHRRHIAEELAQDQHQYRSRMRGSISACTTSVRMFTTA